MVTKYLSKYYSLLDIGGGSPSKSPCVYASKGVFNTYLGSSEIFATINFVSLRAFITNPFFL